MSTLKVDILDSSTGTTITVPTSRVLTITDAGGISMAGTAITATGAELNILDGVTSTTAELNILDGVTSTATELNVLDGIPAGLTATELGYVDGVTSAIQTQLTARLPLAGGTMSGATIFADQLVTRPKLKDYSESYTATSGTGTVDLDMEDGNVFQHTASGGNVTFTFSNPSAAGTSCAFTLKWIQDSSDRTATWPASVDWPAATAPTLTSGSAKVDIFTFFTVDAGTIWYGFVAGQDMG